MAAVTSPVAYDLTVAPLPAKVKITAVTADADGFYYKARQLVEISADETVAISTNAGKAIGQLEDSITTKTNPQGLDARTRVSVLPFGFRRILRMTAEGTLTAGDRVCQGTTDKQTVKKMSDVAVTVDASALSGSIPTGATSVTSDAAQPTVTITGAVTASVAGGVLPEKEIGVVWKGATNGNEALILAY